VAQRLKGLAPCLMLAWMLYLLRLLWVPQVAAAPHLLQRRCSQRQSQHLRLR
jgi:hypothetical protein